MIPWMRYVSGILMLFMVLAISGCVGKQYGTSAPKLITLKTAQLRFNDVGFVRHEGRAVQVELFSAGQVVERFEINRLVCVREGCMGKHAFNRDYLYAGYPDDLLQNVLLGQPIYEGRAISRNGGAFEQALTGEGYEIRYRVDGNEIYFKDRINHILIRIRNLPEHHPLEGQ